MSTIHHPDLIHEIEAFLSQTGMGPTYFGKKAVGNSEVLDRLKSGGRVWPDTEDKLRAFIADNSPSSAPSSEAS